jgi:membrane associated rhomboid family serine protease
MLLILPIGTDNPPHRRPLVNYSIILINAAIYFAPMVMAMLGMGSHERLLAQFQNFKLSPAQPRLYEFITYAFLHGSFMHVFGNMFFLYIFGNSVNEKLGNLGYAILYLGGAVFSAVGHSLFFHEPVLGASGAVAAVTGAYMVLFPLTRIRILYWFIFLIDTIMIPAIYFILFKLIIYDNVLEPKLSSGPSQVAHGAHLAGYAFGILVPLIMLALKLLPHSQFDLWAVIQRRRRRMQFQNLVNQEWNPFTGQTPDRKTVSVTVTDVIPPDPKAQKIAQIRADIAQHIAESNLTLAAENYIKLIELDSQQVLPQQQQLDVANKLMHTRQYESAAWAYESFLRSYPKYPFPEQIQLMLGLLYSRYLNQTDLARKHLAAAMDKLQDPGQKQMCQSELNNL